LAENAGQSQVILKSWVEIDVRDLMAALKHLFWYEAAVAKTD
jgi:hypothetical protein